MVLEVGRVCIKLSGHEAGRKCVVVDVLDRNFVVVSGPRVKRRRCNVMHLEPTDKKLDIPRGCSDEDVRRALEALG